MDRSPVSRASCSGCAIQCARMTIERSMSRPANAPSDRRDRIVDAAAHILASLGPKALTAARLGAEVGITGGAIFRHFATMAEVLDAVIDRMESILFEDFPPKDRDPVVRLQRFFVARIAVLTRHADFAQLLLSDHFARTGPGDQTARLRTFKQRTQQFVSACLEDARAQGRLHPAATPGDGAILVVGAVLAFAAQSRHRSAGDQTSTPERVFDAICRGLFVAAPAEKLTRRPRVKPRRPTARRSTSSARRP